MHIMSLVQAVGAALPAQPGRVPPARTTRPSVAAHVGLVFRVLFAVFGG